MAATNYTITRDQINIKEYENYSDKDKALIDSLQVNSTFDVNSNFIELHIYSLDGRRLQSEYNYSGHKQLLNSAGAGKAGATNLYVDPIEDIKNYGYDKGGVSLLYHFMDNLFSEDNSRNFYIETISPDRTEVRLLSTKFDNQSIVDRVAELKQRFADDPYFNEIRLNFGNNDLFIAVNIDTEEYNGRSAVLLKLYEPLPQQYVEKDILYLVEFISDSAQYTVESTTVAEKPQTIKLRGPNFDLEVSEEAVVPTEYLSYEELFSYPVTSSNSELLSMVEAKGIRLSVDYSNFSNFVKFSSAEERLRNFAYKVNLINSYESEIETLRNSTATSTPRSGSITYYENSIKTILANFDSYEKHLYFESGSDAWPKSSVTLPYINESTASAATWFDEQIASASLYDLNNPSALRYTLPEFLKDNPDNESATIFLDMLGQHFDNIWLYTNAVTEKYNADNRLNRGISRDLVEDALKNFGVKLYTSNFSTSDLYNTLISLTFDPGCEQINNYVTASGYQPYFVSHNYHVNWRFTPPSYLENIAYSDYNQEILKRIYHNLPFLLKTKGTERGVRALINCFGIPSNVLTIEEYGGVNRNQDFYYGYQVPFTSSLDKIRLDNTGSIAGSTLSNQTSIQQLDGKYNQDLHTVEVGFSPTTNINNYIISQSQVLFPSWSLDNYIGDPSLRRERTYTSLDTHAKTVLADVTRYDVFDFVRLIKFFDNTIFKMIQDFAPARSTVTTGIIIKPHALDRSKIQAPSMTWTRPEYSASIDTAFIKGTEGGVISASLDATHTLQFNTLSGSVAKVIADDSPMYNGEFGGTELTVTTQSLNAGNPLLNIVQPELYYDVNFYDLANFTENGQFYSALSQGEIKIGYFEYPTGGKSNFELINVRMHREDLNGIDIYNYLFNADLIQVAGYNLVPEAVVADTNGVYFNLPDMVPAPISVLDLTNQLTYLSPYLAEDITYNEYNALLNNATDIRGSKFVKVDRASGINPSNLPYILSTTEGDADVQETNYSSKAFTNIRYNGTENTVSGFNTGSGFNVQVSAGTYIGYYDNAYYSGGTGPFAGLDYMEMTVKYLIDPDGGIIDLTGDETASSILQQNFVSTAIAQDLTMGIASPISGSSRRNEFTQMSILLDSPYNSPVVRGYAPTAVGVFDTTNKEGLVYPKGLEYTSAKTSLSKAKQILRFAGLI